MKKKLMIGLLVAAGVMILYHALFYRVKMNKSYVNQLEKEYGEYILFTAYEFDWAKAVPWLFSDDGIFGVFNALSRSFMSGGYGEERKNMIMFRWDFYKLRQKIRDEFLEEVPQLDQFANIDYEYDKEKLLLNIIVYEEINGEFVHWDKEQEDIFNNLKDKFYLLIRFYPEAEGINIKEVEEKFEMLKGQLEANYDKSELDLLNKLLINKLPKGNSEERFDLKDTSQIRWTETEGTLNISWLDLRKYSQISGVMDLSKFKKVEYVSLEGLNLLMLQLPPALRYLDEHSVSHCKKIVRLELPETLEYIESAAFEGCSGLKEVVFKGDAPEVRGDRLLFEGIKNKVKILYDRTKKGWTDKYWEQYELVPMKSNDVHIEKGQTEEKTYNSNDLHHLEEIFSRTKCPQPISFEHSDYVTWELVDGVYMVRELDLSKCNDIMGTLDLSVFSHLECTKLKQMRIQEVILPDSFKTVGKSTFEKCQFLKRVVFTGEIKHIFIEGFSGCANLDVVIFKGKAPQIIGDRPLFWESKNKVTIYYDKNKKGWTGDYWKKYNMQENE